MNARAQPGRGAPVLVVLAGVAAALHVGKLAPALPVLQSQLGFGLVQAGWLLSLVQLAGVGLALLVGLMADRVGLRRSMGMGSAVLVMASVWGSQSSSLGMLMACRALEGLGFLWVTLPAPALIRRLVEPTRLSGMLGLWGAYMPTGMALALLLGPVWLGWGGWPLVWWVPAAASALAGLAIVVGLPADPPSQGPARAWWPDLRHTLRAPGPWWVALSFGLYSSQWLAVVGFLPTMAAQAGLAGAAAGWLTALVASVNLLGNLASGRLLQRAVAPQTLLCLGFVAMACGSGLAFFWPGLPLPWRYAGVLVFSAVGGLIPGTLFSMAVRLAPSPQTVSTTVGWVQQWSALGQLAGPPVVAALALWWGDWAATAWWSLLAGVLGALLALAIQRLCRASPPLAV